MRFELSNLVWCEKSDSAFGSRFVSTFCGNSVLAIRQNAPSFTDLAALACRFSIEAIQGTSVQN